MHAHLAAQAQRCTKGADIVAWAALRQLALPCQLSSPRHELPQVQGSVLLPATCTVPEAFPAEKPHCSKSISLI